MRDKSNADSLKDEKRDEGLDSSRGRDEAPDFRTGDWLNSKPLSWKDFAGKLVVVEFFAEWCEPCAADLKRLAELDKQGKAELNLAIVGVHAGCNDMSVVEKAIQTRDIHFPVYVDREYNGGPWWGSMFNAFQVQAMPHTILIDRNGLILDHGSLEDMIQRANVLR